MGANVRPGGASVETMQYRILGRTGERVSVIGLGGSHLGLAQVDEQLSLRIVRHAIDEGITFLDNAWDYKTILPVFACDVAEADVRCFSACLRRS